MIGPLPFADRLLRVFAVCWLGLYLGLRMRSTTQAIGYSLLWTVAVPAAGTYLMWFILRPMLGLGSGRGPSGIFWIVQFLPSALGITYSALLAAWARRRLLARFRELAADG